MNRIVFTLLMFKLIFAGNVALGDALIDRIESGQCPHSTLAEEDCLEQYQELFAQQCTRGSQCGDYVYPSGLSMPPTTYAITTLQQNLSKVRRAVRAFSSLWTSEGSRFPAVDQTKLLQVVLGIGLTELTTRRMEDHYQDMVARLPGGRTLSRSGTLGPFQVSTSLAYTLETLYLQHTSLRRNGAWTQTQIARNLADFEHNAAFATAFAYHIIKQFADRGIDITMQPGIIGTLYNLGTVDESARRASDTQLSNSRRMPRWNAYGYFLESNWNYVENLLR